MTKRGHTLVEMIIATGLLAIMVAGLTALFGFTGKRNLYAIARFSVLRSASVSAKDIEATVEMAVNCQEVANGTSDALVCTMPLNGTDTSGDGVLDTFTPSRISKRGYPRYGSGQRVWYFLSDANGVFGNSGPYLYRAIRNDGANPGVDDIDKVWSVDYQMGRPKRGPLTGMTFTVDAVNKTVQYNLTLSQAIRRDQAPVNGEASHSLTVQGKTFWRFSS